jgi:hypothetical protein
LDGPGQLPFPFDSREKNVDFIRANLSTIIVAIAVFGVLGLISFNLVRNIRKGKSVCCCGCDKCGYSKNMPL